jgi:hypothetical protein
MTAPPYPDQGSPPPARQRRPRDELVLVERLLAAARRGADVRARKVRRLRAAIKVKVYENDLKLAVAVENLFAAMGPAAPAAPEARSPKHENRDNLEIPNKQ